MAFLEKEDFRTIIREYQLNSITDNDDTIIDTAIEMAIEEVSSIITADSNKIWQDGRRHYDVEAIFSATGSDRNALMLGNTKIVAIWHLLILCNTGMDYEEAEGRYDRAIKYLKQLASGEVNSRTLPLITTDPPEDEMPFGFGSRPKFNHE